MFFRSNASIDHQFDPALHEIRSIVSSLRFNFPNGPSEVLPYLLLGNRDDASDLRLLERKGVTHVLNCAARDVRTGRSFYGTKLEYLEFAADDDFEYRILENHIDDALQFIRSAKEGNGKVLIHCMVGMNRSAALCVAAAMILENWPLIHTVRHVYQRRPMILQNESFQHQLVEYARKIDHPLGASKPAASSANASSAMSAILSHNN